MFGAFDLWVQFQRLLRNDVPPALGATVDIVRDFARFLTETSHRLGKVNFFDITATMIELTLAVVGTI